MPHDNMPLDLAIDNKDENLPERSGRSGLLAAFRGAKREVSSAVKRVGTKAILLAMVAAAAALGAPHKAEAQTAYTVTDLGQSVGTFGAINNNGQVVGSNFLYSGGTKTNLGTLGGTTTDAYSINGNAQIVGLSQISGNTAYHAFLYNNGTMADLGTLGGSVSSALGINSSGQVVGWAQVPSTVQDAFLYDGTMHDLGSLLGGLTSASSINDSGVAVGIAYNSDGSIQHAFTYDGTLHDLGTLGGSSAGFKAINNNGQIVGGIVLNTSQHAILYSAGSVTDLGTLGGQVSFSYALAINNNGQIGGYSLNSAGVGHAFLYSGGVMTDLNSIVTISGGSYLAYANGINDLGQIVALAANNELYLLTPTATSVAPVKTLGAASNIPCACDPSTGKPVSQRGDPITVGTGNVFEQVTDYATVGQNPLGFTRYYNSLGHISNSGTFAATLGINWRSNYDRYLNIGSSTTVLAERSDGQVLTFTKTGGVWKADSDVDYKLTNSGSTWTLKDHNDTVETYTATAFNLNEAQLTSIQLRNGYTQTPAYNSSNQVQTVTDSYSRSLGFTYYSNGLLETVTTPDGLTLTYSYNASGQHGSTLDRLASVSYSTNPVTSTTYLYEDADLPFALTGITDEKNNRYQTWSYDDATGRALSNQRGGSLGADLTTLTYNNDGTSTVTNALGVADTYTFTTLQGVPKVTQISRAATSTTAAATRTFTYDTNGFLFTETDWNGNQTTYTNNTRGNPTKIVEPTRTTNITYDTTFVHLPATIVTTGLTSTFKYDTVGELLSRTDTDTTTQTVPYSTNGTVEKWQFTYGNSLLTSIQTPRTDVVDKTQFSYDATGALTKITDPLNHATNITAHTGGGLPQTVVDPNNITTILNYDLRLNLHTSTVQTASQNFTTTWTYDPANNLQSVQLPDNSTLTFGYDTAHRLTGVTDLFGNAISYMLNALGVPTATNVTNPSSTVTRTSSIVPDALGRTLQAVGGMNQTTTMTYDPMSNALSITDPLTHKTTQIFDTLNRLSKVTEPAPGGVNSVTYDTHNHVLTATDANGGKTTYVRDGFGNAIQGTSPDTGVTVYHYDLGNNLTQKTTAAGAITNNAFDGMDRISGTTYPNDSTLNVVYKYDEAGHGFGVGRLTSFTDAAGSLTRNYDERGNITQESRTSGTVNLVTSYGYDAASRVALITYPSGWSVTNTRDSMGRVTAVSGTPPHGSATAIVSNIGYEPFGPITGLTYGNGIVEARTYDLDYRLKTVTGTGTAAVQNLSYGYDASDNPKTITDALNAANTQTLGYDALNHLNSAVSGAGGYGTLAWTFNKVGSILTAKAGTVTTNYNYATKSNILNTLSVSGTTTETFGTTADGNTNAFTPAFSGVTGFTFNQAAKLATASNASLQLEQNTYDADGNRASKVGNATGTTLFKYDQAAHVLEEVNVTGGVGSAKVDYAYLGDRPIAAILPSNGKTYFIETERLGTPVLATDNTQAPQWSATYQPYGFTGTGISGIVQNLRLPGQEWDVDTGFNHNGARTYLPTLGRYAESDPIGLRGGLNTYQYANGNPFKAIDPSGLKEVYVYVWNAQVSSGSVGHVAIADTSGSTLLSQFPKHTLRAIDDNTPLSLNETVDREGRLPDRVYQVSISNDSAFSAALTVYGKRFPTWVTSPQLYAAATGMVATNCTNAAYNVLKAGGVVLGDSAPIWPSSLGDELDSLTPSGAVKKLSYIPFAFSPIPK